MPIVSLYALTIVLYVAAGLLVADAAWSWRNLARTNRLSIRAFRQTARLTAVCLTLLAGTLVFDALVGVLSSRCAALSPCHVRTTSRTSVTIHLEDAKLPDEVALINQSYQLARDCNVGQEGACDAAGRVASALEARGYCRPDASRRWEKTGICAQLSGKPNLALGLPRAGSVDTGLQLAPRSWRRRMRERR